MADYKSQIDSLLPEHDDFDSNYEANSLQSSLADEVVEQHERKQTATEIARMKLREKQALRQAQAAKTANAERDKRVAEENLATLEVIENVPEAREFLSGGSNDVAPYAGTTKKDVVKLMNSLNINLDLRLTRTDTYNLLSCLLTANEAQLEALYKNKKIPLAIKTVIKRLQDDAKLGNIETIEKLWDRIFGKADKVSLNMPAAQELQIAGLPHGIIPQTVVSREAYTIIRDTIIGK